MTVLMMTREIGQQHLGSIDDNTGEYTITNSATGKRYYLSSVVYTKGKLYQISYDVKDGSASSYTGALYAFDGVTTWGDADNTFTTGIGWRC